MLDYKLLEALAMVVKEGGFEKAAKALHLTQSAVSQRVKLLEDSMGGVLLIRTAPPEPTPLGRELIKHCSKVKRLEGDLFSYLAPDRGEDFTVLPVALNEDSLATWFPRVVERFVREERVLLDLSMDDQDQTHRHLRKGEVMGCVSAQAEPFQGCRVEYLGRMEYRLVASPGFVAQWFPEGFSLEAAALAPSLIFNRRDELFDKFFPLVFGGCPESFQAHYVPSSEKFPDLVAAGWAYGMLPDQQSAALLEEGKLVDLAPGHVAAVDLYWHCWNIRSRLMDRFTEVLVKGASKMLARRGGD